jgi:hypothetical protein
MSDTPAESEGTFDARPPATGDDGNASHPADGRDYALHSVVVTYEDGPDRCTLYPRRNSCCDRMSSWLSADFDAFVGLEEMR